MLLSLVRCFFRREAHAFAFDGIMSAMASGMAHWRMLGGLGGAGIGVMGESAVADCVLVNDQPPTARAGDWLMVMGGIELAQWS